jgi:hypothetical protein
VSEGGPGCSPRAPDAQTLMRKGLMTNPHAIETPMRSSISQAKPDHVKEVT